jgi:plasmid stabilization system protein ParE
VKRRLPVRIVASAAEAIADAAKWWVENRPKAPAAFAEELTRALDLVASEPAIGAKARNAKLPGLRPIHLARIRYYLYYRVRSSPATLEVLALWHSSRGSGPQL